MHEIMFSLAIGFVTLMTGRQLYWLFIGGVAFFSIFLLVPILTDFGASVDLFFISLGIGLIIGFLASVIGRAVAAGVLFLLGGYLLFMIPNSMGLNTTWLSWVLFLLSGLVTVFLVFYWFDFAMVLLSSLTGAGLIVQSVKSSAANLMVVYIAMVIFGMATQLILMQYWPALED
jgi:hypothetical protein